MKIIAIGDIVGEIGRKTLAESLPRIKSAFLPDVIIANGENAAANGRGITRSIARELFSYGVDCITLGNHTWDQAEIFDFIDDEEYIVRPSNYPPGTPGKGWTIVDTKVGKLYVVSIMGRSFMRSIDCPFQGIDEVLSQIPASAMIFVDVHAETTSEKLALAWYMDGKVSTVVGTHTHVQTGDERILPQGTGYITDLGMVGAYDGILGMEQESIIRGFKTQLPVRFTVAKGRTQLNAIFVEVDSQNGKTKKIKRIRIDDENLFVD